MKEELIKLGLTEEQANSAIALVETNLPTLVKDKYVPIHRFNEVNTELQTEKTNSAAVSAELKKIKDSGEDPVVLKEKITTLEGTIKDNEKKSNESMIALRKENAIKLALAGKVHNVDVAAGLIKADQVNMNEDGTVKSGLEEQVKDLQKTQAYLFIPESNGEGSGKDNSKPNIPNVPQGAKPLDGKSNPNTKLTSAEQFAKNMASNKNASASSAAANYYFSDENKGGNQ